MANGVPAAFQRRGARALAAAAILAFISAAPSCAASGGGEPPTGAEAAAILEEVSPQVEAIRGLRFRRPVPVTVIDDAKARGHAIRRFRKFYTEAESEARQRALRLLGLLPPAADVLGEYLEVLEEQAGGFYDPESGGFLLLGDMPRGVLPMLASHELGHALEDQHFGLDARLLAAGDDDEIFAVSAVHEGSATLVMTAWTTRAAADGKLRPADVRSLQESDAGRGEKLAAMPEVLRRDLIGSYLLGASFFLGGRPTVSAGPALPVADVNRAFREGPRSSEQILHPEKYWGPGRRDEPLQVEIPGAARALGEGWRRDGGNVLGELVLGVLVGAKTPDANEAAGESSAAWTNAAAEGWGGDRWELWSKGDRRLAILGTVWDSERDAEEFAAMLPSREGLAWRRSGDRVAVVAGDADGPLGPLAESLLRGVKARAGRRGKRR